MRGGVLQQFDSPQTLYEQPRNVFVAGFIGSPAMNLVEATLERADGVWVKFGSHRLRVPEELLADRPAVGRAIGRPVVLGIRPDDFEDAALVPDAPADVRLPVQIDLRETLGREAYIHFVVDAAPVLTEDTKELAADTDAASLEELERTAATNTTRFVASVSAKAPAVEGGRAELVVEVGGLHFFDPETGEAIYGDQPPAAGVV
jgi:multiple sugar transport system ATP-binding protein